MSWFKINSSGYKIFTDSDGVTRSVHKRVAEKKVGGSIYKGYEVHHKDGDKDNNRQSNLSIIRSSTHRRIHSKRKSFW